MLGEDFKLPRDQTTGEFIRPPPNGSRYWLEELNLLYVAVTRAQAVLVHSRDTWDYLRFLRQDQEEEGLTAPRSNPTAGDMSAQRRENETKWTVFEQQMTAVPDAEVTVETTPWPTGPPGNILALDTSQAPTDRNALINLWLRRLHPDRFLGKYRDRVSARMQQDGVKETCERLTRAIIQLREEWLKGSPQE